MKKHYSATDGQSHLLASIANELATLNDFHEERNKMLAETVKQGRESIDSRKRIDDLLYEEMRMRVEILKEVPKGGGS